MNKLQILSFLLVICGMVAHLTACHDGEGGELSSEAIDEGKNGGALGGNIAPVAPIPEPLSPPIAPVPFVLDEGYEEYFESQGAKKPAATGNEDTCGNGEIEDGEECDDANVENGNVCKHCRIVRENCSIHIGEGSTYIYCTGSENYTNAQDVCRKFGPFDLVTISSSQENTFIGSFITENSWIGINDIANEGTFVWVSGIPVTYTNWAAGEPNNDGDQDCGLFLPTLFTWDDLGCATSLSFVCELENPDTTVFTEPIEEAPTEVSDEQPINEGEVDEELSDQPAEEELDEPVDESEEIPSDHTGEEGFEQPASDELAEEPLPNETERPADGLLEQPVADGAEHHFDDVIEQPVADEAEHHLGE